MLKKIIVGLGALSASMLAISHYAIVQDIPDATPIVTRQSAEARWECVDSDGVVVEVAATEAELTQACADEAARETGDYVVRSVSVVEETTTVDTKRVRGSAELIVSEADAQFVSGVRPLSVASITSGNLLGSFSDSYNADEVPVSRNYIWADDTTIPFASGNLPAAVRGLPMIHTRTADAATEGGSTVVSFDLGDDYAQVIVFHADSETTKPTWLTTAYDDCGLDIFIDDFHSGFAATLTGTVNLGGNCPTGGCAGTPDMYVVALAPAYMPVCETAPSGGESNPGTVEFEFSSYTGTEETELPFRVVRNDGCDGAASVSISETANPSNGVLNTASASWGDGDCTPQSGTVTLADVSGDQTMTLGLSSPVGATLDTQVSTIVNIIDDDTAPTAAEYWISATGTGNGLSAGSPAPPSFASTIQHPGGAGDVIVHWSGALRNYTYDPSFSGLSATQMIKHCSDGTAVWRGPSSGSPMQRFFNLDTNWIDLGADCGSGQIEMDGECTPVNGSVSTGCRVQTIGAFVGNDNNVGAYIHNTQGWVGLTISGNRNTLRGATIDIHGAPRYNGDDWGDVVNFSSSVASSARFAVMDSTISRVGHNPIDIAGGTGLISGNVLWNRWSALSGFTNEGNRVGTIRRAQQYTVLENNVLRTNGIPADTSHPPLQSLDGRNGLARWNFVIDSEDECFQLVAQNSYRDSVGQRIAHNLFYECEGPAVWAWHYEGTNWDWGNLKVFNNVFVNVATNPRAFSEDGAITFNCGVNPDITDWRDEIFVKNNLFFGSGSSQYVVMLGCPGPSAGRRTVQEYQSLYPDNFSGNVFVDPLWVSPDIAPDTLAEAYAAFASQTGSPLRDAAAPLAVSNNAGSSATALSLDDSTWWTDGHGFGAPATGPDAGGYQIRNITRGWTATVTGVNHAANDITISPAQTWQIGDEFGYVNTDIGPVDSN